MRHYFNRYFVFKLLTVSVFFFVTSCSLKPEPPLRIGINLWPGYELLHVASVLDLYEENSINIVELSNATAVMQMLRNDQLEGAALTLDEALTLIDEGLDLKIILVTDISNGGDALLVKPEIETLPLLKDKSIAVENTAVGAIMLYSILKQANLNLSDIDVLPCTVDRHEECFDNTDGVITFEPVRTNLLHKKAAVEIFNSSHIPATIVDVVVIKSTVINSNKKGLQSLLNGYFKAHDNFTQKDELTLQIMAARQRLSKVELIKSFNGILMTGLEENLKLLTGIKPDLYNTIDNLNEILTTAMLLDTPIISDNIIENSFLLNSRK